MLNSPILDVAIGVALVYLLISLLCSTGMEVVANLFKLRARDLEEGIRSLLGPGSADSAAGEVFESFFNHPLIRGLIRQGPVPNWQRRKLLRWLPHQRKPSYIPSKTFAATLFEVIAPVDEDAGSQTLAYLKERVAAVDDVSVRRQLTALLTHRNLEEILEHVRNMQELDGDRKAEIEAAASDLNTLVSVIRRVAQRYPGGSVRQELANLVMPASMSRIRSEVEGLPREKLPRNFDKLLDSIPAITLREKIEDIGNLDLRRSLRTLLSETENDIAKARKEVEDWYDQAMVRVSGWYKRRAQLILIALAIPVVAALNADTVTMATSLWQDDAVREVSVTRANQLVQNAQSSDVNPDSIRTNLSGLTTLGWRERSGDYSDPREVPKDVLGWLWKGFGFAVTVGAASLGSDFWFNLIKKLLSMRPSGPSATTGTTGSTTRPSPA